MFFGATTPATIIGPDAAPIRILLPQNNGISAVSAVDVRTNFPETWLFEMETVGYVNETMNS